MKPEIRKDSLSSSYYGQDIYVEAWQPDGGKAYVHLVEAGNLPDFNNPDCGEHDTLVAALDAGLRFAVSALSN
ncbi:hypothetical protein [Stenotrophomonas sp. PS02289]|uniref:hypothetical protein n=1 Tax=Stenotrophomonas sp. PS02289 TaxID=2991422 RepID=UPI00249B8F6B|nr:hypothetical protein [Stenotrophomonas sp. PS02289]